MTNAAAIACVSAVTRRSAVLRERLVFLHQAQVVLPHKALCGRKRCRAERSGKMLCFDRHHPSLDDARIIARMLEPLLPKPAPSATTTSSPP